MVRLVAVDPPSRQVAVDLPARSAVSEAVAARSARLADAAHEPLFGYEVVVDAFYWPSCLAACISLFSGKVLEHLPFVILALVVVVEVDLLEVRGPGDCRVEPPPSDIRELVVEDRDGLVDAASLEGAAGPAVVVYDDLFDQMDGESHRVAQRYQIPSAAVILYS